MSGSPRDLAAHALWEASLARSRERRRPASPKRPSTSLSSVLDARNRLPSPRDLIHSEPWELSTLRSRTRRRAAELQFVPSSARARRFSLGTLIAMAAGPAAGLADASGSGAHGSPAGEPPITESHRIVGPHLAQEGSRRTGRRASAASKQQGAPDPVELLQHALGVQADGVYGPASEAAVRRFQAHHGLAVDGVVGAQTWATLGIRQTTVLQGPDIQPSRSRPATSARAHAGVRAHVASETPTSEDSVPSGDASSGGAPSGDASSSDASSSGASSHTGSGSDHGSSTMTSRSTAVTKLQEALGVPADGSYGRETEAAVRKLQARHGLTVDGVVGPQTWSVVGIKASVTLHPPHAAHSHTAAGSSADGSGVIARVIAAADEIATRPYTYGGGHGSFQSTGYDCSGSVSYALHGGGLLSSPEDSSELESYGEPGAGRHITIYANAEHAWMVIDGRRFDTIAQQETGTRWSDATMSTAGYVVRHPRGL